MSGCIPGEKMRWHDHVLMLGLCLSLCGYSTLPVLSLEPNNPQSNPEKPVGALPFTLIDTSGLKHNLNDYRSRSCALFFFCGCHWCVDCAPAWAALQKSGDMPVDSQNRQPQTLIVFAGNADAARSFAVEACMDVKNTVILLDPNVYVTLQYHAEICPRSFVIDANGVVRYTNNHKDDAQHDAHASVIIANVLGALRASISAPSSTPAETESSPLSISNALTVLSDNQVQSVKPSHGRYDFGRIDTLDVDSVEHTFTIRNDQTAPIILDHLGSSCGCTSAFVTKPKTTPDPTLPRSTDREAPLTLLPHETAAVRVLIDPAQIRSGIAHKFVWVFTRSSRSPAATLEMTGTFQAPISCSPSVLNFGTVTIGATPSLKFTATFDPRLLRAGQPPLIVCTNPDVQLIPDSAPQVDIGSPAVTEQPPFAANTPVIRTYTVRLSPHMPIGVFNSSIVQQFHIVRAFA